MAVGVAVAGFAIWLGVTQNDPRVLWSTTEGGYPGGRLVVSPAGGVLKYDQTGVGVMDAGGRSRPLIANRPALIPMAGLGQRGFLATEHLGPGGAVGTRLVDWAGQTVWSYPVAAAPGSVAVSKLGTVFISGADTNLHCLGGDGTLRWKMPLDNHPSFFDLGVGGDDSLATALGTGQELVLLDPDGTRRWTRTLPWSGSTTLVARDPAGGVIAATPRTLNAYSATGETRWTMTFPPQIPKQDAARGPNPITADCIGLEVDARGYSYCQGTDGLIYVLDHEGSYRWSYPRTVNSHTPSMWLAFSASGDAIFVTAEVRLGTTKGFPGFGRGEIEFDRLLVCLSPEGQLRWEIPLSGSVEWKLPKSLGELKNAWRTRMGRWSPMWPQGPVVGTDGIVYVGLGDMFGLGRKIWVVRGH